MKKAYIYPITARLKSGSYNPYIDNFIGSAGKYIEFLNKDHPSNTGIFNIVKYLRKADYIFLNWIVDITDKKGGYFQFLFIIMIIFLKRLLKIKIVYVLHNKISHDKKNYGLKKFLFRDMIRNADYILTHAREGLNEVERNDKKSLKKARFYAHPLKSDILTFDDEPQFDILIWGSILPYKNIDTFLEFLHETGQSDKYKIQIVGKASSQDYFGELSKFQNSNISITNDYISFERLKELIKLTKVIVFTYSNESVLSSGALMDSISFGAKVIGPDTGAFKDLAGEGIVETYRDFEDLVIKIDRSLSKNISIDKVKIQAFIEDNSWEKFAERLNNWINAPK